LSTSKWNRVDPLKYHFPPHGFSFSESGLQETDQTIQLTVGIVAPELHTADGRRCARLYDGW
jgi:hypothetical protein